MEWKLAYAPNYKYKDKKYVTIDELYKAGFEIIDASVPGNFEIDLMKAGKIDDLYYSTNALKAQQLENMHIWYFCSFEAEKNQFLRFDGIDTIADIYINGEFVKSTDNMFMACDVYADWKNGKNELIVHIKPAMLESRKYLPPVASNAMKYNNPTLYLRKAAHMFGWDIMPRIVSAGIWKDVKLCTKMTDRINEVFFATNKIDRDKAFVRFYINTDIYGDFANDYTVKIEGVCKDSSFLKEEQLWHNTHEFIFMIDNPKLWWPKNTGEQNLYDTTVSLYYKDTLCDAYNLKLGIRTTELDRTDATDKDGNGEFCFKINGKKIFVLGTNWVPLDAFHSNDEKRLEKALDLLEDIGCNMVRCWGGNVYESNRFYEFCDEHGIMVWQDFAMGCAVYPQNEAFAKKIADEAEYQIKRLRNHPSIVLWAGDNECDLSYHKWNGFVRDPNNSYINRIVLKNVVLNHDYTRPYLPSSPYMSEKVVKGEGIMPEEHLWGPRDYFKGDFYKNTFCHFASETGYHGFPSPKSLNTFLKEPDRIFKEDGIPTDEYLVHAASMELSSDAPNSYRIKMAYEQVTTLFGKAEENFDDFVRQSQISQAEAKKYFIEKFRIGKWKRTGIIWWNLLDGWPQISDAVVDYYYTKKLAYSYIKRSQRPVCLIFDEPVNNRLTLVGVNDFTYPVSLNYTVKKLSEDRVVLSGKAKIAAESSERICILDIEPDEKEFYLIEWKIGEKTYKNHYFTNIIDIDYKKYITALKNCGMDEFEGF